MTTKCVARLYHEHKCPQCKGCGIEYSVKRHNETCSLCKGKGKVWQQLAKTHAYSYETALDKLFKKKRNIYGYPVGEGWHCIYAYEDRFFLVWSEDAHTGPIDITPAVSYRLHDWQAKDIYRRDRKKQEQEKRMRFFEKHGHEVAA